MLIVEHHVNWEIAGGMAEVTARQQCWWTSTAQDASNHYAPTFDGSIVIDDYSEDTSFSAMAVFAIRKVTL